MPSHDGDHMGLDPRVEDCDCHACRPDDSYETYDRRTIDAVLKHGWQVLLVGTAECECCDDSDERADDDGPAFAYTVGLGHRTGHPELVMSGLDPVLMHRALNVLAQRVLDGRRLAAGDVLEGVLGGVPVFLADASRFAQDEVVTWSGWFHRRPPEALVVVWPTTSGVFAWQPGAPAVLDVLQPPGWRDPIPLPDSVTPDPVWVFPVPPDLRSLSCTHVVDEGAPVLWVARQSDRERGEDWSLHCGAEGHEDEDVAITHLAHLVRGAPSLRAVGALPLDWEALRADADGEWVTRPLL